MLHGPVRRPYGSAFTMTTLEWIGIFQTIAFFAAVAVAWYVGKRQANISEIQAKISEKQAQVSSDLLDLQYAVSLELAYDSGEEVLAHQSRPQYRLPG